MRGLLDWQDHMFTLLSAILWLGNIEMRGKHGIGGGDDTVEVMPGPALSSAATLLGVPEAALIKALSKRNITAGTGSCTHGLRLCHMIGSLHWIALCVQLLVCCKLEGMWGGCLHCIVGSVLAR